MADEKEHNKLLGWLATRLHKALGSRVEAASEIMQWLQKCSKLLSDKAGLEGVSWRTPSGWPWSNAYLIEKSVQKEATVEGAKVTFRVMTEVEGDPKQRREKRANGISANFVHALDAAALVSAINRAKAEGVSSITAIHDSVGGLAPDMDAIRNAVREGFIEVHLEADPLGSFYTAVQEALPPDARHLVPHPPATGDFDIKRVRESEYFFC